MTSERRIDEMTAYVRYLQDQGITHLIVVRTINHNKVSWTDDIFDFEQQQLLARGSQNAVMVVDIGSGGGCSVYSGKGKELCKVKGKAGGENDPAMHPLAAAKHYHKTIRDALNGKEKRMENITFVFAATYDSMRENPELFNVFKRELETTFEGRNIEVSENSKVLTNEDEAFFGSK